MASTDARPIPVKNTAYRVYFPILDADGDLVTGAAALDSERSLDGGTFADCTNEATEVATASGIYFLDLTASEMNTDCTVVIVKTTTVGAKTTVLTFYPNEAGDFDVDVTAFGGTAGTFASGRPEVNVSHYGGSAGTFAGGRPEINVSHYGGTAGTFAAGRPEVNTSHISGTLATADKLEAYFNGMVTGTADSGTTTTCVDAERTEADTDYWRNSLILFTSGSIAGQCRLISGFNAGTDTITFTPSTSQAVGTNTYIIIPAGRVDVSMFGGTLGTFSAGIPSVNVSQWSGGTVVAPAVTGVPKVDITHVGGTGITAAAGIMDTKAASLGTTAKADVNAEVVDALATDTYAEVSGVIAATSSIKDKINWMFALSRNKLTQTASSQALRNDADSANIATAALSDDGTTAIRAEFV